MCRLRRLKIVFYITLHYITHYCFILRLSSVTQSAAASTLVESATAADTKHPETKDTKDKRIPVIVSHVVSPSEIYGQHASTDAQKTLTRFDDRLKSYAGFRLNLQGSYSFALVWLSDSDVGQVRYNCPVVSKKVSK